MDENTFDALYQLEAKHWWFVGRRRYISSLISGVFNKREPIYLCEMGCGSGGNFEMLADFGKVDAMEMDDKAFQRAKHKGMKIDNIKNVKNGWLPDNITIERSYDAVIALDVIEHIEDDTASLKAIMAHIKPEGYLFITVPAYQWLWSPHDDANHHKRRYTKSLLIDTVEQAGYRVTYCGYFNTLLFPLTLIVRLLQKLSPPDKSLIDEFSMPSKLLNNILTKIFSAEHLLAGRLSVPVGLSIALIARVKEQDSA